MKTISAGLAAHLEQNATTLATCWKVTRTDGQVFGFTDHDKDLVVSSVTYKARTGYKRSMIETNSALAVDNLELEGAFDDVAITEADLIAGLWDYASVQIFVVNWADLTQGIGRLRKGRLGEVRAGRTMFTTELRGLLQNLQQEVGREYSAGCAWDLGDSRCGIVLAGSPSLYTFTGAITHVTSRRVFRDSALVNAAGFFNHGKITFTGGENVGLSMEVKTFTQSPDSGAITLQLPMPFTVQVGDTYSMHSGCDKTRPTCRDTYNNIANYGGFPDVPGMDEIFTGGR